MDSTWTTSLWQIVMMLALGSGAGIVAFIGLHISQRPKLPKDLQRSRYDLELGVRGVVHACVELSERVRDLVVLCRELPPEYRPIAEQTIRYAQLIEEATFEEGQRHGVFPRPLFTSDGPPPSPRLDEPGPEPEPPTSADVIRLPASKPREWIGGQLLPASWRTGGSQQAAGG